jgi:hypothetical protein
LKVTTSTLALPSSPREQPRLELTPHTRERERERERERTCRTHTGGGNALAFKPPPNVALI